MAEGQGGVPASAERRSTTKGPDPLIGRVINDRFRVVALIARGGMGKVYRAEQAPLGREVALKVLNPNYSGDSDPEFHKRFFLEASTCSKLTHPNTVTIFDYGRTDDDVYYIAMELLEGRTLHRMLRDDGPFNAPRALHIARQVCRSLREAHSLGVIHRDLKPANIFLVRHGDENDFVKVLDFGLVKELGEGEDLTQTGLFMGSPKYMSPEQIRGENVDGRADIYALGVITYEMLTGKVPFDRPNSVNILMAHVHEAPPPIKEAYPASEVPPGVEQIVMKALAKKPEDRFSSMDEMLNALKRTTLDAGFSITRSTDLGLSGEFQAQPANVSITGQASVVAPSYTPPPVSVAPPAEKRSSAKLMFVVLAALGLMLVVGAVGIGAIFATHGEDEAPRSSTPVVDVGDTPVPVPDNQRTQPSVEQGIATAMVVLRSQPAGAAVRVGDHDIGQTPADIEWTGEDAARGRQVTFLFHLDGYRDYSVTRVITGDRLEVRAELEPLDALPDRANRPRRPTRPRTDENGAPIKGYKLDPY
jgi:serine/threonine protein kinase